MKLNDIISIIVDNSDMEKRKKQKHVYYLWFNDYMEVCTKNPKDKYFYTVYKTGEATKQEKYGEAKIESGYAIDIMDIDEDYIPYSTSPIIRAGYILYDKKQLTPSKILTEIFDSAILDNKNLKFISAEPCTMENIFRIELEKNLYSIVICDINDVIRLNRDKSSLGMKCLPFMKSVSSKQALYVYIFKESRWHNYVGSEDKIKTGNIVHDIVDSCKMLFPDTDMRWKGLYTKYLFY